ncbi:Glutamine synthetase cytosolic isozyme 1-3 [Castilleja foliolosa]|uniref:Glutamine synthetase cytosolic isozyme 1-3 n=1 Tax=Castilleja foliolosa TaxID=1961234 RepID=A0ABD3BXP5_9LAMI
MGTRIATIFASLKGVANCGASIRVGRDTEKDDKGYFEDRRPASSMEPYVVTSMIAETTIIGK